MKPASRRGTSGPIFSEVRRRLFSRAAPAIFQPQALRAALFIMLYRDEPLFRLPLCTAQHLDRDRRTARNFRYRHLQMVRRMIGTRIGTGGSSGEQYLQGAVNKNYIYKELAGIITFLIERAEPAAITRTIASSFAV